MEVVLTILIVKIKFGRKLISSFMFMCDLRGINQSQIKERSHTSALEELLRCAAMKGTQFPYSNPGSHFFGVQPGLWKAALHTV